MENFEKRGGFGPGTMVPVGLLLVYLFFPFVFVLPVEAIYGNSPPRAVEQCLTIFLWPLDRLCRYVPPYRALIETEGHLLHHN